MASRPKTILTILAAVAGLAAGCQSAESAPTPAAPAATIATSADPAASASTALAHRLAASPTAAVKGHPKPGATTKPTANKAAAKPTTKAPAAQNDVPPGAFCSPEGAIGHTSKGALMRCTRKAGDDRARWRAA